MPLHNEGTWKKSSKSCRNCRHVYSLQVDAAAIITDMLYSLIVDPADTAIMQLQGLFRWSLYLQKKSGLWLRGYIVTCMHSAISDLSYYITMYLQNKGLERETMGQESLITTILSNLLFPYIPPLQGLSPHSLCAIHLPQYCLGK